MSRANAKRETPKQRDQRIATSLKQLDTLNAEPKAPPPKPEVPGEQLSTGYLSPLAHRYLDNAITSLKRWPSGKLKPDFRATLVHWRQLMLMASKSRTEVKAFIAVVLATIESDGSWQALRIVRNVSQQLLWQCSADVQRDRRVPSELEEQASNFVDGEDTHIDNDRVPDPTEDEAIEAYEMAHGWLSMVADLLPVDSDDRARLNLDGGLEFCQEQGETGLWTNVYDVQHALDIQLEKNRKALQARDARTVLARTESFNALAALLEKAA